MKYLTHQIFKFICVGLFCTAFNYAIFFLLLHQFEINYKISATIGFFAGVFAGFFLNKNWTFQSESQFHLKNLLFYFLVYTLSLALGLILLHILVEILDLSAEIGNIIMIGFTTVTNFVGLKFGVFKKW